MQRDEFVSCFLEAWFCRHPGVAVCLNRVGSGSQHSIAELGRMGMGDAPYSRKFDLDCVTAAAVNALFEILEQNSALNFALNFEGPQMHKSLKTIGGPFQKASIDVRIDKISKVAIRGVESSNWLEAFNRFVNNASEGVYIVQLINASGVQQAVESILSAGVL